MKKIIALLLLLVSVFMFVACEDDEESEEGNALIRIYQEHPNYETDPITKVRIGDTEWTDVEYTVSTSFKNVEAEEKYFVEVYNKDEDKWVKWYPDTIPESDTAAQEPFMVGPFKEGLKYQVRLLDGFNVVADEVLN